MGRSIVRRKFGGKCVGCPESKNTNAIKCLKNIY
jgi:Fe-S cluster biogenesis protein NfuA